MICFILPNLRREEKAQARREQTHDVQTGGVGVHVEISIFTKYVAEIHLRLFFCKTE